MVVAAGQQPGQRVRGQRPGRVLEHLGHLERPGRDVDRDPAAPRDVTEVLRPARRSRRSSPSRPASRPAVPAAYGGDGRRCASTRTRGERKPRDSTASPAAAQPSRPATATTSPGRAPERVTGSRPSRTPSAVTARVSVSARAMSPPTTLAPTGSHSSRRPSASDERPVGGQVGRRGQADQQGGRHGAHGGHVGEVLRGGLAAHVVRARTSPAGSAGPRRGGRCTPRRARRERRPRLRRHRGRAGRPRPAGSRPHQPVDQAELPHLAHRARRPRDRWHRSCLPCR